MGWHLDETCASAVLLILEIVSLPTACIDLYRLTILFYIVLIGLPGREGRLLVDERTKSRLERAINQVERVQRAAKDDWTVWT